MASSRTLRGSCSCGRNQYLIEVPAGTASSRLGEAHVYFDNTSTSRRQQATPLAAFLHVPLSWYNSRTIAFYPDETHALIRKTYEAPDPDTPSNRRQFCGYCGTQLSSWDERTRQQAQGISLTLGSLEDEDLEVLEELGLLPDEDELEEGTGRSSRLVARGGGSESGTASSVARTRGAPWFEELIEDSRLGRVKRQRGGHSSTSSDGATSVQWEVVELDESPQQTTAKRKIGDVEAAREPSAQ